MITLTLRRFWLDLRRYRSFSLLFAIAFAIGITIFFVIYPGPEFANTFYEIPIFQVLVG